MTGKLIGDKIEEVLDKMGGKKVSETVERITNKPCGCQKRKQAMNNWHKRQIERAKRARSKANRGVTGRD